MAYTSKIIAPHLLPKPKTREQPSVIGTAPLDEAVPELSKLDMMNNLTRSLARAAASGFKTVDSETFEIRMAICRQCEFWLPNARFGFGKCLKCGCTEFKQRLVNEKCPIAKW